MMGCKAKLRIIDEDSIGSRPNTADITGKGHASIEILFLKLKDRVISEEYFFKKRELCQIFKLMIC